MYLSYLSLVSPMSRCIRYTSWKRKILLHRRITGLQLVSQKPTFESSWDVSRLCLLMKPIVRWNLHHESREYLLNHSFYQMVQVSTAGTRAESTNHQHTKSNTRIPLLGQALYRALSILRMETFRGHVELSSKNLRTLAMRFTNFTELLIRVTDIP